MPNGLSIGLGGDDLTRQRLVIAQSWKRCLDLGLAHDTPLPPPIRALGHEVAAFRDVHPLAAAMPICAGLLDDVIRETGCAFGFTNTSGLLLCVHGDPKTRRPLEAVHFAEGADWSELAAGTNAVGTALTADEPVRVAGPEHFSWLIRSLSGSAAPVHDPKTGRAIGAIVVSGGPAAGTPVMLALVRAVALAAEHCLDGGMHTPATGGRPWISPTGQPSAVALSVLNRDQALLQVDGDMFTLTPRRSEIVMLLALHHKGLTANDLAKHLPSDNLTPTSIRVEVSRLRHQIGENLLTARPYALHRPVHSDIDTVNTLLQHRRVAEAMDAFTGPPLPGSHAPEIMAIGADLAAKLRYAVLTSYNVRLLRRWIARPEGKTDPEAWATLASLLPIGLAERQQAEARAAEL